MLVDPRIFLEDDSYEMAGFETPQPVGAKDRLRCYNPTGMWTPMTRLRSRSDLGLLTKITNLHTCIHTSMQHDGLTDPGPSDMRLGTCVRGFRAHGEHHPVRSIHSI